LTKPLGPLLFARHVVSLRGCVKMSDPVSEGSDPVSGVRPT
jgi:hypothetical protein